MRERSRRRLDRVRLYSRIRHATALAEQSWHLVLHSARVLSEHAHRIDHLERLASIEATMRWIGQVDGDEDTLVTVVMITRNRSHLVPRAVASVLAQEHENWELVVVDDHSEPDHAERLVEIAALDDRIRLVSSTRRGPAASRNIGLEVARGAYVTYLDDDNMMHPRWLKAVVWGFAQRPEVDVACGARLIDDLDRARGLTAPGLPAVQFEAVDAMVLERRMQTDAGCIAHRSSVTTRFDERFGSRDDWDWLRRALQVHQVVDLPCLALTYTTDTDDRLSG